MEDLISRFGLLAVYLGAAVEGDAVLVLAGVVAHLGLLDLPLAMAVATAGCVSGDLVWYGLGRIRSESIRSTRAYRAVGPTVERLAARVGPWQIASSRILYGTRIVTMLYWGIHRLSLVRFALIDLLTCATWAVSLGGLGYFASKGAMTLLGEVQRAESWLLGGAVVVVVLLVAIRFAIRGARVRSGEAPQGVDPGAEVALHAPAAGPDRNSPG